MNIAMRKFDALKSGPPVSKTTPMPWLLWNSARMIANTNSPSSSNSTPVLLMIATTRTPKMFSSVMTTSVMIAIHFWLVRLSGAMSLSPMSLITGISVSGSVATTAATVSAPAQR